jgi:hypothetical protein
MDFVAVLAAALPDGAIAPPQDYNGHLSTIDVTHPVSWINEDNKLVLNAAGQINTRDTIAYSIYIGGGRAAADPTGPGVEAAIKRIGRILVTHSVLSVVSHAGVPIAIRSSDVISAAAFAAMLDARLAAFRAAADKAYTHIITKPAVLARVTEDSKYVVLSFIATAIHRIKHDGHNWLSDKTDTPRTETHRCLAIAAEMKMGFGAYMKANGHDGTHFLTDACLSSIADALTGNGAAMSTIPANAPFLYNGVDVAGRDVHTFMDVGDAARDRWPVGQLGVAGLAKGCDAMSILITDVSSKVHVSSASDLTTAISTIKADVCGQNRDRPAFLAIKNALVPAIVMAYGYINNAQGLRDALGDSEALANLARSNPAMVASGGVLANRMREVTADSAAIGELIRSTFDSIRASIDRTHLVPAIDATGRVETKNAVDAEVDFKVKEAARKANVVAALEKVADIDVGAIGILENL